MEAREDLDRDSIWNIHIRSSMQYIATWYAEVHVYMSNHVPSAVCRAEYEKEQEEMPHTWNKVTFFNSLSVL